MGVVKQVIFSAIDPKLSLFGFASQSGLRKWRSSTQKQSDATDQKCWMCQKHSALLFATLLLPCLHAFCCKDWKFGKDLKNVFTYMYMLVLGFSCNVSMHM